MADDIAFKVSVDEGGQGAKSLSQLKKEFKELQKEVDGATKGTEEYRESLSKLANVKDEIEDLNEEIQAFQGAGKFQAFSNVASSLAGGFQAATGAAALFGGEAVEVEKALLKVQAAASLAQGIKSLEGFGQGLTALGNVLKANPLMLFASVLVGIGAALFAVRDKIKVVGDFFEGLGDVVRRMTTIFFRFTDAIGLTTKALDDANNRRLANFKAQEQAAQDNFDHQIRLLNALGKETDRLEIQRQNQIIRMATLALQPLVKAREEIEKVGGTMTDEILKFMDEQERIIRNAQNEIDIIEATANKKRADDAVKTKADQKARELELEKLHAERIISEINRIKQADLDAIKERSIARENEQNSILLGLEEMARKDKERVDKGIAEDERLKKQRQDNINATIEAATLSTESLSALSDAYFNGQLNRAKGNEKETKKILERQFKVEKAFATARAIIDGIRSINAALTIPPPAGPILAAFNGLLATANVARIQSTQFNGGGGGATGGGGAPSLPSSSPSQSSGGVITTIPTPPRRQDETVLDANGNTRVILVESDVTDSQNKVKKVENQASF